MLHTTRAIVLRTFKHGDRTTVLKAYTEAFGARSYMVRIASKSGSRNAALQPLGRLELVVTETSERDMHAVRELRVEHPYTRLHIDHARGALALFAQEVCYRTLREETADPALFSFIQAALEAMDTGDDIAHFPLILLTQLTKHLGFFPEPPTIGEDRFDLREGCFFSGTVHHEHCMEPALSKAFASLLTVDFAHGSASIPSTTRRELLDQLLVYFRLHVDGFGELRSPEMLHQVLR